MTLTFTVDGNSLPLPRSDSAYELEYIPFGVAQRAQSGALRVQYTTNKYRTRINWTGLSAAERTSLLGLYSTYIKQAGVWLFPTGLTFSGTIALSSWTEAPPWYSPFDGIWYYDVSFTVEQA